MTLTGFIRAAAAATVAAAVGIACGASNGEGTLTVMAASSLTDAFDELAAAFETSTAGAGVEVQLILAGSSRLATQLEEGAPADLVATADTNTMDRIAATDRLQSAPVAFAANRLVVAVNADAGEIESIEDLAAGGAIVAVCAEQVPCGSLTVDVLEAVGLELDPATREPNVRSVLNKVLLGEVDAGFVYASDVSRLDGDVRVFVPEVDEALANTYPIATLTSSAAATAFVEFVRSPQGLQILTSAGFEEPR